MSDLLTVREIENITGAKQTSKQAEILAKSGFFYWHKMDGSIAICWHHIHNPKKSIDIEIQPDYSGM